MKRGKYEEAEGGRVCRAFPVAPSNDFDHVPLSRGWTIVPVPYLLYSSLGIIYLAVSDPG